MPRYMRKTAILAKVEATYGVDPVPVAATDAMLVSNVNITPLNVNNVDRDLVRGYLGGSEQLAGTSYVQVTFDVELAGSLSAGTAPAWGPLLRACGFAEATATTPSRVEYTLVTNGMSSAAIYYHLDGVLHKVLGARGTCELKMGMGERPVMSFNFSGLDGGVSAVADPTPTLTAFRSPVVITDPNSGDVTLGGAYAAGAITGGTGYPGRGLMLNLGNEVQYTALTSGEGIDITKREVSGDVSLDLTPAQYVSAIADVKANVLSSLSYQFGTAAGNTILVHAPAVQRISPAYEEYNGRAMAKFGLRLVPVAGNDELRICIK
jgi:hypothetical protein